MTQLVRDQVSHDLAQAITTLHEAVQAGHIVGLAFGVALRGRRYFVNTAGTLTRDPTFARGIIAALDDELSRMVQGRADAGTTTL
jgi:hypothetical protein